MFFVSERSEGLHIKRKPFGPLCGVAMERKKNTKYYVSDLISTEKKKNTTHLRRLYISCETVLRQLTTTNLAAFVQRTAKHRVYVHL
jgi:hypothetical protein